MADGVKVCCTTCRPCCGIGLGSTTSRCRSNPRTTLTTARAASPTHAVSCLAVFLEQADCPPEWHTRAQRDERDNSISHRHWARLPMGEQPSVGAVV